MAKNKNFTLILIISFLLLTGLYINFILQKDFLTQLGFEGLLAIICILFFDASKIISEILFFKLTPFPSRIVVGFFSVLLICLSVYTTFSVRVWKSQISYQKMENVNLALKEKNDQIQNNAQRLNKQVSDIEGAIRLKKSLIKSLSVDAKKANQNKWIISRYSKVIDKLNRQKTAVLKRLESNDTNKVSDTKKKLSLHRAMMDSLGTSGENLELVTNLMIAVVTDGIILFLCFGLSYLHSQREKNILKKQFYSEQPLNAIGLTDPNTEVPIAKATPKNSLDNEGNFRLTNGENILFYDDSESRGTKRSGNGKKKSLST